MLLNEKRRWLFGMCLLAVWTLLAGSVCFSTAISAAETPPNVVLIISDDQAWGDYGFMGHPQIKTPHLDRLAAESLTFARGYVPDSLCRPSLATIMTGLYPHQHGIVGNDPPVPTHLQNLPKGKQMGHPDYIKVRNEYINHIDDDPCLPKLLAKHGYLSHQSGKWWEGHYSRGGFTHGMTHGDRTRGGRHGDLGLKIGREGLEPVKSFVKMAQKEEKPFLVYYAPFLPHTPHTPPQRLLDKYRVLTDSLPIAKYWAMCEWFDETIGELVNFIDDSGLGENTIFVYVTDNGWINDAQASKYAPKSKRSQYDGGTRTPILIRWKGKVEPDFDQQQLASSIDIVPTLLAACGLEQEITPEMEGINLLDVQAVRQREKIFGEILHHDIVHMTDPVPSLRFRWVISGNWKLILPYEPVEGTAPIELYDLATDPHEQQNLAEQKPDLVKALTADINNWWPVP